MFHVITCYQASKRLASLAFKLHVATFFKNRFCLSLLATLP